MTELIIAIAAGCVGVIVFLVKWLIKSMSGHVDRLADNFDKQTDRVVQSVGEVKSALNSHIKDNKDAHREMQERMSGDDKRHETLVDRMDKIEDEIEDRCRFGKANGEPIFVAAKESDE